MPPNEIPAGARASCGDQVPVSSQVRVRGGLVLLWEHSRGHRHQSRRRAGTLPFLRRSEILTAHSLRRGLAALGKREIIVTLRRFVYHPETLLIRMHFICSASQFIFFRFQYCVCCSSFVSPRRPLSARTRTLRSRTQQPPSRSAGARPPPPEAWTSPTTKSATTSLS